MLQQGPLKVLEVMNTHKPRQKPQKEVLGKLYVLMFLTSNPESTAKELPIDVRSTENGRELACGCENL